MPTPLIEQLLKGNTERKSGEGKSPLVDYLLNPENQRNAASQPQPEPAQEPGLFSLAAKGTARGLIETFPKFAGTATEYLGTRLGVPAMQEAGKVSREFWGKQAEKFNPPESLQGNIWDNPKLMARASWWAYNLPETAVSMAASLIPGGAAYKFLTSAGALQRAALVGASIVGGAAGGALEGANTFEELQKKGASPQEAALGAELMTAASAGLNAISTGKIFGKALSSRIVKFITDGTTEGLTEWLEEPSEGLIKMGLGYATPAEVWQQMKEGVNVYPLSFVTGGVAGAVSGDKGTAEKPTVDNTQKRIDAVTGNMSSDDIFDLWQEEEDLDAKQELAKALEEAQKREASGVRPSPINVRKEEPLPVTQTEPVTAEEQPEETEEPEIVSLQQQAEELGIDVNGMDADGAREAIDDFMALTGDKLEETADTEEDYTPEMDDAEFEKTLRDSLDGGDEAESGMGYIVTNIDGTQSIYKNREKAIQFSLDQDKNGNFEQIEYDKISDNAEYADVTPQEPVAVKEEAPVSQEISVKQNEPDFTQPDLSKADLQQTEESVPAQPGKESVHGEKKEPWQMTREKYGNNISITPAPQAAEKWVSDGIVKKGEDFYKINIHKRYIESALSKGKLVPAEVLAEYPDLAEKYGKKVEKQKETVKKEKPTPAQPVTSKGSVASKENKSIEPWKQTLSDFQASNPSVNPDDAIDAHMESVQKAVNEGKPVPASVLKDYPTIRQRVEADRAQEPRLAIAPRSKSAPGTAVTGVQHKDVVEWVARLQKRFSIPIVPVRNINGLPSYYVEAATRASKERGIVMGLYDPYTEAVWIVSDGIRSKEEFYRTILHETAGHAGLRRIAGKDYENFLLTIANSKRYQDEIYTYAAKNQYDIITATDEWFAEQVETGKIDRSLWSRFVAAIRKTLRSLGINMEFSEADLKELVRRSYEAIGNEKQRAAGLNEQPMFSNRKLPEGTLSYTEKQELLGLLEGAYDKWAKKQKEILDELSKLEGNYWYNNHLPEPPEVARDPDKYRRKNRDKYRELDRKSKPFYRMEYGFFNAIEEIKSGNIVQSYKELQAWRVPLEEYGLGGLKQKISDIINKWREEEKSLSDESNNPDIRFATQKNQQNTNPANILSVPPETWRGLIEREFFDKYNRMVQVQQAYLDNKQPGQSPFNVIDRIRLFMGRTGDQIDRLDKRVVTGKDSLLRRMTEDGIGLDEMDLYLYASHAKERNEHVQNINAKFSESEGGSGMTNDEADIALRDLASRNKPFEKYAKEIRALAKEAMDLRFQAGLIDKNTRDRIVSKFKNYVPLKGNSEKSKFSMMLGRGFSVTRKEFHRLFGRESKAESPFAQILIDYQEAVIRSENNAVGNELLNLIQEAGEDNILLANGRPMFTIEKQKFIPRYDKDGELLYFDPKFQLADNVMAVKRNEMVWEITDGATGMKRYQENQPKKLGNNQTAQQVEKNFTHYITINDRAMAEGMKNLGQTKTIPFIHAINNYLRMVNTVISPSFIFTNMQRDLETAGLYMLGDENASFMIGVMKDVPNAMRGIWRDTREKTPNQWSDLYDRLKKLGGKVGFFDLQTNEQKLERLKKNVKALSKENPLRQARGALIAARDLIMDANESVEGGVRLAYFKHLLDKGVAEEKAAIAAKQLTIDFNQRGNWATILNTLYLFANANLQGGYRFAKWAIKSKRNGVIVLSVAMAAMMLAMRNRWVGGDDYDRMTDNDKDNHLLFMLPGGKSLAIKVAYGFNVPVAIGNILEEAYAGKMSIGGAMSRLMVAMDRAFNPMSGGSWLQAVSPTFLDPGVQLAENRNAFGSPIYKEQPAYSASVPDSQLYFKGVNPWLRETALGLNRVTGGTDKISGWMDISPETVEHIAETASGGLGKFVMNTINTGLALSSSEEETEINKIPIVREFVKEPSRWVSASKAREMLKESGRTLYSVDETREYNHLLNEAIKDKSIKPETARRMRTEFRNNQTDARKSLRKAGK